MTTPCFRLLTLGPPKHGKTTFLKGLAQQLGSWNKATLTVRGQSDLFAFSIREVSHPSQTLETLTSKRLLLDGVLLVQNLAEPLDDATSEQLRLALKLGLPLRLVIATHRDAFGSDEALLDEYELAFRQQLSTLGANPDLVPILHSAEGELAESAEECIQALHRMDWGVPLAERPRRALVVKSEYPEPIFQISLQQGTLRINDRLELLRYERQESQESGGVLAWIKETDVVSKIVTEAGEQRQLSAPSFASITLHGAGRKPGVGALLVAPRSLALGRRARAQVYFSDTRGAMNLWIPKGDGEKVLCWLLAGGPTGTLTMVFHPVRGFMRSLETCEAELACTAKYSNVFLAEGQSFFWRTGSHLGGGVVTALL